MADILSTIFFTAHESRQKEQKQKDNFYDVREGNKWLNWLEESPMPPFIGSSDSRTLASISYAWTLRLEEKWPDKCRINQFSKGGDSDVILTCL